MCLHCSWLSLCHRLPLFLAQLAGLLCLITLPMLPRGWCEDLFSCVYAVRCFLFSLANVTFVTGCWNSEVQSEAVQTHNSKQVPRGIGVSSVLLPSTFHVSCNNSNSGHSSWLHGTAACSSLKCDERQYTD